MPKIHTTTIIPYDIWKVRYRFRGNITAKNRSTAIAVKVKTELAIESNRVYGMILHKTSENVPFDQSIICPCHKSFNGRWHAKGCNQKVCQGHIYYEIICDSSHLPVCNNDAYDQRVTDQWTEHDDEVRKGLDNLLSRWIGVICALRCCQEWCSIRIREVCYSCLWSFFGEESAIDKKKVRRIPQIVLFCAQYLFCRIFLPEKSEDFFAFLGNLEKKERTVVVE